MLKSKTELRPYSSTGSTPDLKGTWSNELRSTMEITTVTGGKFSGIYTSMVSVPGGLPVTGALAGFFAGDTISFVVNWGPAFHSTSAWTGLILTDAAQNLHLHTLWNVVESPGDPDKWWECILAGTDRFWKVGA